MDNTSIKTAINGFFPQALIEYPNKQQEIKSKIAFGVLFCIFLLIGIGIIYGALEKKEFSVGYIFFGVFLCVVPVLIYLLVSKTKARMITKMDKDGVVVRSGKFYAWEHLQKITYHMAMKKFAYNTPDQCYMMDLFFTNGTARASYIMQTFPIILAISKMLPVPKKEKVNAYRK